MPSARQTCTSKNFMFTLLNTMDYCRPNFLKKAALEVGRDSIPVFNSTDENEILQTQFNAIKNMGSTQFIGFASDPWRIHGVHLQLLALAVILIVKEKYSTSRSEIIHHDHLGHPSTEKKRADSLLAIPFVIHSRKSPAPSSHFLLISMDSRS